MSDFSQHFKKNLQSWENRTPVHMESRFYNNEKFKSSKYSLNDIERSILQDVSKQSMLHLQCHFGQDTISWANLGAEATGVDFSPSAIKAAKELSNEVNVPCRFIESNVLELDLEEEFDIVFSSYGAIGWLPNLKKWGEVVAKHLKKGGTFLLVETHPFLSILEGHDYFFDKDMRIEKEKGSYTDGGENLDSEFYWWNHSLTEIFVALESNGLKLQSFEEYNYTPYLLKGMVEREAGKHVLKDRAHQNLPYVFSLKATKK
ncbi:MAG: class I SAM-dependent methyltransferase [Flavobacteriales bacterium]|nr:class I SAM-dependent methyltransferase [Flavobacteriales bacterium]MBL6873777.1 class I SAM-dependent methyltransferase [Flavobacteriales bacterium]